MNVVCLPRWAQRSWAFAVAALVGLGACGPTIRPPQGPGTEWPCGYHGKSCDPVAPGMCCMNDEICGYDGPWSRCPAGYCCYDPGEWPAGKAPRAGEKSQSRKQQKPSDFR